MVTAPAELDRVHQAAGRGEVTYEVFVRALRDGRLLLPIPASSGLPPGRHAIDDPDALRVDGFELDGTTYYPVFSSPEAMLAYAGEPLPYAELPAPELFALLRGSHVVLDQQQPCAKHFTPDEIDSLLATDFTLGTLPNEEEDEEEQALVSFPAEPPRAFMAEIGRRLASLPFVATASLMQLHRISRMRQNLAPTLLVTVGLTDAPADGGAQVDRAVAALVAPEGFYDCVFETGEPDEADDERVFYRRGASTAQRPKGLVERLFGR